MANAFVVFQDRFHCSIYIITYKHEETFRRREIVGLEGQTVLTRNDAARQMLIWEIIAYNNSLLTALSRTVSIHMQACGTHTTK